VSLRQQGYKTLGFTDGGYLHRSFGLARGFQHYNGRFSRPEGRRLQEHFPRGGARNPVAGKTLFDRAIAFLEHRRDRLSPFFLFVQTYSVHDYYNLHPWAVQQLELSEELDRNHVQECAQSLHAGTPEEWELLRDLYRAEVDHVDASLGRLLDAVDRLGLEDSTLILLVSDHGEGFDPERKRIHHGGRPEEDVVRVPFLL
jgi:arylsulfatase A-like enzyme